MDTMPNSKQPEPKKVVVIFNKILAWCETHRPQFIYIRDFLFVVIIYGALLSYVLTILFHYKFSFQVALALGILFYFIKEELPRIINKSIPKTRN
jgi:hypothetical protein